MRWPKRGEIWMAELNPTAGRAAGLTPDVGGPQKEFNCSGLCLICPVGTGAGISGREGTSARR
jgi:mRNA-degrading endonuclease toxin of MazEF toxin-antitoxin module